ncbi:nitrate reductase [NADH] [Podospora australis]|uniref:Nitrate reductase [NADPH] n=1 Tax=Podospora australis TaxID=1536484 RepID=A0AAN6WQM4_9PEZI|nr:nitrate reductase [NADH] [Podospora australis]
MWCFPMFNCEKNTKKALPLRPSVRMPHHFPWEVKVRHHPGSTKKEIHDEPEWTKRSSHSIGFKNQEGRRAGISHPDHEDLDPEHAKEIEEARQKRAELKNHIDAGDPVNFRDVIEKQTSFHIRHPENRSLGWRYVLETTEDFIKNQEKWPINTRRREESPHQEVLVESGQGQKEETWRRHEEDKKESLSPQERSLLEALEKEATYISHLQQSDGKKPCLQKNNRSSISIDEQDQFTPDNWLPRCPDLIRLTGNHPMNAEPSVHCLLQGGLITPNEIHYVRNHGAVPRLLWELHHLEIEYDGQTVSLTMDALKNRFHMINIPVAMACTGNRRKELNLLRKTKGANNAAASVGCAYWKGPLLRDVLLAAGIPESLGASSKKHYVNFAGADSPSEGPYETSIPFEYAMDPTNDVLLAMYMNDLPLPPDHGYPVRLMIPGYIGGRCVKWLKRIWISDHENESFYHIWDNRAMPPFVVSKDSEFAKVLFRHPSTACYEQNMNSVIAKPAQGEVISLGGDKAKEKYRIEGYAYNGGGHEIQHVEVSLDGGDNWLFATTRFPEFPIRHGNKFWTWIFWHVDVNLAGLAGAGKGIMVRCLDSAKNIQPQGIRWNLMGMMNNSWYTIKPEIITDSKDGNPAVMFRHPTEAGSATGGWMQPSEQVRVAEAKQTGGAPQKEFTREEIEKHDKEGDCWIVVDYKVYDATSVLNWHPGGKPAILAHAGKCHQETTDHFRSIHDDFAWKKLHECILGKVTQKTADFIKQNANAVAKAKSDASSGALEQHRWVPVKLIKRTQLTPDTRRYTFALPDGKQDLGLGGTCQHIQLGFHLQDKMLVRPYTPTRPILPATTTPPTPPSTPKTASCTPNKDRTFDLTIKTYFPTPSSPGGALSNLLDCMPLGEEIEIRGPAGDITYLGHGSFSVSGPPLSPTATHHFNRVSLVLGGSGITPGYALMARIAMTPDDMTQVRVIDANRSQKDILLRDELDKFERETKGKIEITHVLSQPDEKNWEGERGYVTPGLLRQKLFPPDNGKSAVFLCGPPGLVNSVLPALKDWGYVEDKNMFGF